MEVEENQPPRKKLKQATLTFFKGKSDASTKSESQGRKRLSSTGSESPSKAVKLSKPFSVLSYLDSSNSKLIPQVHKSISHDSSDQEVSSSSEADSAGNKSAAKGLMDRFVKKVPNDCNQEISSTNNDLDSMGESFPDTNSETEKENCEETTRVKQDLQEEEPDCLKLEKVEHDINDAHDTGKSSATKDVDGVKSMTNISHVAVEKISCPKDSNGVKGNADNVTAVICIEDDENVNESVNASFEIDTDAEIFNASLTEKSESDVTSTPIKSATENTSDLMTTPKNTSEVKSCEALSSNKKRRKVDLPKRADKEALKQKLKEEKEQIRLDKKRKMEEEKADKERLRKEQKEAKEKAKQELKDKQAQEKLDKDKLKEEERLKREEERKLKEEQKLKKQAELEVKQEEKKKKEEEKRQKEEEKLKEEEEKRKKDAKVKMAFQSFFKTKETSQKSNISNKSSTGIFIPFELKKDMHLAPTMRRDALSEEKKASLDQILQTNESSRATYLLQLKREDYKPHKMGRLLRKNPKPADEMDLEIIHDSEALKKVFHKVKILKFHTDNRPPYFGTWRKQTKLDPRNPFAKDEDVFDYEVDSDDEWEEEEPGESLSCSDGEEEKEDNEEEEEDGWMVPHGYLSEDEGCNEDDEISPEKLKLQQLAKAKAWDEEQKRKFHALPIVVVGCFFEHSPSISMSGDVRLLYEYKAVVLLKGTHVPTALSCAFELPKCDDVPLESNQTPLQKGPKKQRVPDEAIPDLIRLLHGNICGIKRLIREFRLFWLQKNKSTSCLDASYEDELKESINDQPADVSMADDSMKEHTDAGNLNNSIEAGTFVSKSKEEGHGCEISKRQLEIKIMAIATREKRQCPKKFAWFVHEGVLAEYGMENIQLPNSWVFLSSGPSVSPAIKAAAPASKEEGSSKKEEATPVKSALRDQRSIMDFTMTKEEAELKKSQGESSTKLVENFTSVDKAVISEQGTPKEKEKKTSGQRSIMDFAKSTVKSADKQQKDADPQNVIIESNDVKSVNKDQPVVDPNNVIMNDADGMKSVNKDKLVADPNDFIIIDSDDVKSVNKDQLIADPNSVIMNDADGMKSVNKDQLVADPNNVIMNDADGMKSVNKDKLVADPNDLIIIDSDDVKFVNKDQLIADPNSVIMNDADGMKSVNKDQLVADPNNVIMNDADGMKSVNKDQLVADPNSVIMNDADGMKSVNKDQLVADPNKIIMNDADGMKSVNKDQLDVDLKNIITIDTDDED